MEQEVGQPELYARAEIKIGSERSFGLVFAAFFAIIALWPVLHGGEVRIWAAAISVVFGILGLLFPHVLRPLNWIWFRLGLAVGAVVAPVIMTVVFVIVVVPIGLLRRLLGHDPLRLKRKDDAMSYWIERDRNDSAGSMSRPF